MVSGSEMKALKTVSREHGKTTTRLVSRQLGIDAYYATVLCKSLIKSKHLDQEDRGRFKITSKGKKALGWSHGEKVLEMEQRVPFKNLQREEFQWRSCRTFRSTPNQAPNGFFKPGQDEVGWNTITYGNGTMSGRANGNGRGFLITEKTHPCGFCGGTGKKEKGAKCPICRGTGNVNVIPPAVSCAFCKGRGLERKSGRICPVCRGKGVVSVHPPIAECGGCKGSGTEQGTGLTCLKCSGKGVVHVRENNLSGSNGGRN